LCDLCGWSSEKEPQRPQKAQNDEVVYPLPRGAKTPKICALCVLCGLSLHPTVQVAIVPTGSLSNQPRGAQILPATVFAAQISAPHALPFEKWGQTPTPSHMQSCSQTAVALAFALLGGWAANGSPPATTPLRQLTAVISSDPAAAYAHRHPLGLLHHSHARVQPAATPRTASRPR
jgi:hypothetical protein